VTIPRGRAIRIEPLPRLVLFDLDDTLCDHDRSLEIRVRHAFEPFFDDEDALNRAVLRSLELAHEGTAHFEVVLAEFGALTDTALEHAAERYISDRYRGLELFDDALFAIEAVKHVAEVGMITNGPTDIQQPKLDLLEIEPLFSFVLISESVGFWKPDPRIFQLALEQAEVEPHQAIYVGDSVIADVPGAHAAGVGAVWMNRRGIDWPGERAPDVEVRDLFELLTALGLEQAE